MCKHLLVTEHIFINYPNANEKFYWLFVDLDNKNNAIPAVIYKM